MKIVRKFEKSKDGVIKRLKDLHRLSNNLTNCIIVPTEISHEAENVIVHCEQHGRSILDLLNDGLKFSPAHAVRYLETAVAAHVAAWNANVLDRSETVPIQYWIVDPSDDSSAMTLNLIDYYDSDFESVEDNLSSVLLFAAAFCEMLGTKQRTSHGRIHFQAVIALDGSVNEELRELFGGTDVQISCEEFVDLLKDRLADQKREEVDIQSPRIQSIQQQTEAPVDRQPKTATKRHSGLLVPITVLVVILAAGVYFFYPKNADNRIHILASDDKPTALGKLPAAKPTELMGLHREYVQFFGEDCYSRFYQPEDAARQEGAIVVPVTHKNITAAVAVAGPKSTVYVKPGTYEEENLVLRPNISIVGLSCDDSMGDVIIKAPDSSVVPIVSATRCGTVVLENLVFEGNAEERASGLKSPALEFENTGANIRNCRILNSPGSGMVISGKADSPSQVVGVVIDSSGATGIEIVNGAVAIVSASEISKSKNHGLLADNPDTFVSLSGSSQIRSQIIDCEGSGVVFANGASGAVEGIHIARSGSVGLAVFNRSIVSEIRDVSIVENGDIGLFVATGVIQEILDVEIKGNAFHGIQIQDPLDEMILQDVRSLENDGSGLYFQIIEPAPEFAKDEEPAKIAVSECRFDGNSRSGLTFYGPLALLVESSFIKGNSEDGIVLENETGGELQETVVESNGGFGVISDKSSNLVLTDNTIEGNTKGDTRVDGGNE